METPKIPRWIQAGVAVVGTALMLIWAGGQVDWENFAISVRSIRMEYTAWAFIAFLGSMIVYGIKTWTIVPESNFWRVLSASLAANLLYIIPMGGVAGSGLLIAVIKKDVGLFRAGYAVAFDILGKFFCMMLCLMLGALCASVVLPRGIVIAVVCITLLTAALILALLLRPTRAFLTRKIAPLRKYKYGESLGKLVDSLQQASESMAQRPGWLLLHGALGVAGELLCAVPYFILSLPLGIRIPLIDWIWINGLARIFSAMPVSLGGFGVRESTLMVLLGWLGVHSASALTLSLLYSVLNMLSSFCGGFFLISVRKNAQKSPGKGEKSRNM